MKKTKKRLGEMLIEAGLIDEFKLKSALSYQKEWGGRLGSALLKKGFVSEQDMMKVLEQQFGLECINLCSIEPPRDEVLNAVPLDVAKEYCVFPLELSGKLLTAAISDPADLTVMDEVSFKLGLRLKPLLALESDILRAIAIHYEGDSAQGRTFQIDRSKLQTIESRSFSEEDLQHYKEPRPAPVSEPQPKPQKKSVPSGAVLESLIDLLIKKNIISREELLRHIKARAQK